MRLRRIRLAMDLSFDPTLVNAPPSPSIWAPIWKEIHTKEDPDQGWWDGIVKKVSSYFCACGDFLKSHIAANPPRFNDWFSYSWELHNAVNAKPELNKPQQSFNDALACWKGIAPGTKPNLLITVATGRNCLDLLTITGPTHRAYAERCNADYVQLTNQLHESWRREKFRVGHFADQYERCLFLDADVIVRDTCEDLFPSIDRVIMHDDLPCLQACGSVDWMQPEYDSVLKSQGVQTAKVQRCLNSGVVGFTSKNNPWVCPINNLPESHCAEQWWVDFNTADYKLLADEHNWQWWFKDFWDHLDSAKIVHLASLQPLKRIEMAKRLISGELSETLKPDFFGGNHLL